MDADSKRVLELFRRGIISSGKAAELLGIGRIQFIQTASALGIPVICSTPEQWEAELRNLDEFWDASITLE